MAQTSHMRMPGPMIECTCIYAYVYRHWYMRTCTCICAYVHWSMTNLYIDVLRISRPRTTYIETLTRNSTMPVSTTLGCPPLADMHVYIEITVQTNTAEIPYSPTQVTHKLHIKPMLRASHAPRIPQPPTREPSASYPPLTIIPASIAHSSC